MTRVSRESDTRERGARKKVWAPPSALDAPEPPEGFAYRWVRADSDGKPDTKNLTGRFREGWEPVQAKEIADFNVDEVHEHNDRRVVGAVRAGDLILCKMPVEYVEQRKEYYAARSNRQQEAVRQELMQNAGSGVKIRDESKSRTTRGGSSFQED